MLRNCVAACLKKKMKLVFASTSDVYGKNPELPYSEKSNLVLGPTTVKRWAYAVSKIYGEQYIMAHHEEFGLDYSIVRFFGSYGENQNLTWWGGPQSGFISAALNQTPIDIHGDGSQTRTFTYVNDTIDGLYKVALSQKANGEIFNIGTEPNSEISIKDLATLIWKMINGDQSEPLLNYIPYSTFGNYEDVMRRVPDITKISTQLGFQPRFSLRQGLARTIEWQTAVLAAKKIGIA
jgi:UDP-glucose 4-epimerase